MMNMTIKVDYADGTSATVKSRPATEVAFERKFNLGLAEAFEPIPTGDKNPDGTPEMTGNPKTIRMEYLYFIAWHATKQGGDFDAWMETLDDIELIDSDSPDPSTAAPSITKLPLSPTTSNASQPNSSNSMTTVP